MSFSKYLITLLSLILLLTACNKKVKESQQNSIKESILDEKLVPIKVGPKYGYVNENDEIVIAPIYQRALPFHKGRAIVHLGHEQALIDETGEYIIEPKKMTRLLWEGNYSVRRDKNEELCTDHIISKTHAEKYATAYDLDGNAILDDQFSSFSAGAKGHFIAKNEAFETGVIDLNGNTIIPFQKKTNIRFHKDLEGGSYIAIDMQEGSCQYFDQNGNQFEHFNPCNSSQAQRTNPTFDVPARFKDEFITHRRILKRGMKKFSIGNKMYESYICLLYTSPSPRDATLSRMPSSA